MKVKLKPYLCYVAGLQTRSRGERSSIGIQTSIQELEQHFIEICLNDLKVEPNRLIIQDIDGTKHIFFYHSKLAKQLREISDNAPRLFRLPTKEARSYIAGIFDASGHVSKTEVIVRGLTQQEALILEQLGIRTKGTRILNIRAFINLIKEYSTVSVKVDLSAKPVPKEID